MIRIMLRLLPSRSLFLRDPLMQLPAFESMLLEAPKLDPATLALPEATVFEPALTRSTVPFPPALFRRFPRRLSVTVSVDSSG